MKKIVTVWPWPMHPKVAAALAPIDGITLVEARPGGPGPVLAIRSVPPFACDAIVVSTPQTAAQGVDLILEKGIRMVTVRDTLGAMLGKELPFEQTEKQEKKVKFT